MAAVQVDYVSGPGSKKATNEAASEQRTDQQIVPASEPPAKTAGLQREVIRSHTTTGLYCV
jgi:hypothetical protein